MSEYFFAGLKLGGALMELSEIYANLLLQNDTIERVSFSEYLIISHACGETVLLLQLVACKLFVKMSRYSLNIFTTNV